MKWASLYCLGFLASIPCIRVVAQDQDVFSSEQLEKWSQYYCERATQYEIRLADDPMEELVLVPTPVMRWANPVLQGTTHGECFVWTHDGRPEVFVSLFSYQKNDGRVVAHAFNTLSDHPLVAMHDATEFWTPKRAGTEDIKPIPGAPPVANSRVARLTQMRRLVRQFTANRGGTDGDELLNLRLLTTPLYRYEQPTPDAPDGAVFAFVTGTDPEVILLIESRRVGSELKWHFIAARHTYLTLHVLHQGTQVWDYQRNDPTGHGINHTYRSQHGVDSKEAFLP